MSKWYLLGHDFTNEKIYMDFFHIMLLTPKESKRDKMIYKCFPYNESVSWNIFKHNYSKERERYITEQAEFNKEYVDYVIKILGNKAQFYTPKKENPLRVCNELFTIYIAPRVSKTNIRETPEIYKELTGCTCPVIIKHQFPEGVDE